MNITYISYSDTGFFTNLIADYLSGKEKTKMFYEHAPQLESFKNKIAERTKTPVERNLLVSVLLEQNSSLPESEKVLANIESLKNNNTFTVTTGHQLNLFTGPLYFVYKIISTVNLAEKLKQHYPENNFVPVYWMHCEDHDFAEINHIHVFGKKVEWKEQHSFPAGDISTATLFPVIDKLKTILGESENARELIQLFNQAYLQQNNLAEATRFLCHRLFGKLGLVVLDARDKRLKKLFTAQFKRDIFCNSNFHTVRETNAALEKTGYKTQVNPREINCFYLTDGKRERIVKNEKYYEVLNTSLVFSKEELENEIEKNPEKFSPNVVLRPLYQECILPNLAYVGGGAELSYWLQYKKMFHAAGISFPLLMLRNSVMIVDEPLKSKIEKLYLKPEDFFKPEDKIIAQFLSTQSDAETSLANEKEKLNEIFNAIKTKAVKSDTTLEAAIEAEFQKQLKILEQIESRIKKAEKRKHETAIGQIKTIREKLFPAGNLQERHENFSTFYMRYGKTFINLLKENLHPFDYKFMILEPSLLERAG